MKTLPQLSCDLLEKSYLCGINNNENVQKEFATLL